MNPEVDWDFARSVAERISGREPFAESYHRDSMERDLIELTAQAEELVAAETGLESTIGAARGRVTDRMGWIDANLASFDRLLRPLLGKVGEQGSPSDADSVDGVPSVDGGESPASRDGLADTAFGRALGPLYDAVAPVGSAVGEVVGEAIGQVSSAVGPKLAGAEAGALLGWMSSRVLGQYDLLIIEDERPEDQDLVYYVGPNILSLEKRYGFPPREFRLWIAVHECTHRAQFTGVPWLRPYFLSLVNELVDSVEPEPGRLLEAARERVAERRAGNSGALAGGGLSALLATPEQRATMDKVTGLMSLLEGHGDITMDRAAKNLIPSQPRFAKVMSQRRKNATGLTKIVQRLTGMEAKLAQYEEGEKFVLAVEATGGRDLFDLVWTSPETLPDIDEIRDPSRWIERMGSGAAA